MNRTGITMGIDQSFPAKMEELVNVRDLWRMMEFYTTTSYLGFPEYDNSESRTILVRSIRNSLVSSMFAMGSTVRMMKIGKDLVHLV